MKDIDFLYEKIKGCEKDVGVVSREKIEALFDYLTILGNWNSVHNLTSVDSFRSQVSQLLLPSLAVYNYISTYNSLIDLGSGGGFPGLALAIIDENKKWTLVEKSGKKASFLRTVVHELRLSNAKVLHADFLTIPVDETVGAIVSRGSAKLKQQIKMTEKWREKHIDFISMQTKTSLEEIGEKLNYELIKMPSFECGGMYLVSIHA